MLPLNCGNNNIINDLQVQNETNYFVEISKIGNTRDQQSDIKIIAYATIDKRNQIPIKCRWYKEQGGRCYLIGTTDSSSYQVSPSDIGYIIVVEITPTQGPAQGTSWARYGPIKLDENLRIKLQDILSIGCAKFQGSFYIENQLLAKDFFIDLHMNYIKIGKDQQTFKFTFSLDQPIIDLNSVDSANKLSLVFKHSQEYVELCEYLKIQPTEYGRIGIDFRSRASRDLFTLAFRCFAVKSGLINNIVLRDTVFSQGMLLTDVDAELIKKDMDLCLQHCALKNEVNDLIDKVKQYKYERTIFKKQIKRLEEELSQTIRQYTDLLSNPTDLSIQEGIVHNQKNNERYYQDQLANNSNNLRGSVGLSTSGYIGISNAIDIPTHLKSISQKKSPIFDKNPQVKSSQSQLMLEYSRLSDSIDLGSSFIFNTKPIKVQKQTTEREVINFNILQYVNANEQTELNNQQDKQINHKKNKIEILEQDIINLKNKIDLQTIQQIELQKEHEIKINDYQKRIQDLIIDSTRNNLLSEQLQKENEYLKINKKIQNDECVSPENKMKIQSETELLIIKNTKLLKKYNEQEKQLQLQNQIQNQEDILYSLKSENEVLKEQIKKMQIMHQSQIAVSQDDTDKLKEELKQQRKKNELDSSTYLKELLESNQNQTQLLQDITLQKNKLYNTEDALKIMETERNQYKKDFEKKQELFSRVNQLEQIILETQKLKQENQLFSQQLQNQTLNQNDDKQQWIEASIQYIYQQINEIQGQFQNISMKLSSISENQSVYTIKQYIEQIKDDINNAFGSFEDIFQNQIGVLEKERNDLQNKNKLQQAKLDQIGEKLQQFYNQKIEEKQSEIIKLQNQLEDSLNYQQIVEQRYNEQQNMLNQAILSSQSIENQYKNYVQNLQNQLIEQFQQRKNTEIQNNQSNQNLIQQIDQLRQQNTILENNKQILYSKIQALNLQMIQNNPTQLIDEINLIKQFITNIQTDNLYTVPKYQL